MGAIDSIWGSKESVRTRDVYCNKVEDVKHAINFLFLHFPIELGLFFAPRLCRKDKELVTKKSQLWSIHVFGVGKRLETYLLIFITFVSVSEDGMPQASWGRLFTYRRDQ